jgi:hypothetical protein
MHRIELLMLGVDYFIEMPGIRVEIIGLAPHSLVVEPSYIKINKFYLFAKCRLGCKLS